MKPSKNDSLDTGLFHTDDGSNAGGDAERLGLALFEGSVQGVAIFGSEGPVLANRPFFDMLGYSSEKQFLAQGPKRLIETVAMGDRADTALVIAGITEGRKAFHRGEISLQGKARKLVRAEWTLQRFTYRDDPSILVTAYVRDQPDSDNSAVQERAETLKTIFDSSPAIICYVDTQGKYRLANRLALKALGLDEGEMIGTCALDSRADMFSVDPVSFARALVGEHVSNRLKVGTEPNAKIYNMTYLPRIDGGVAAGVLVVGFDVSEREQTIYTLQKREERFRKLVDMIPYGVTRTDLEGVTRFSNPAYDRMMGYEPGEMTGARVWDLIVEDEKPPQEDFYSSILRDMPVPVPNITKCRTKSGQLINVLFHWMYEKDEDGNVTGFISVVTDVTKQLEAEADLREAKEIAERASREKSSFLAAAGHDLQQPLHSMSILLGLLDGRPGGKRHAELINTMERALEGAMVLLRGVLEMSKLEAGVVTPRLEDFNLSNSFAQVEAELGPQLEGKPVELRVLQTSVRIRSDRLLLKTILHNLVSNAIRYTAKGKILIGCRIRDYKIRIEVWDTGKGIPAEKQKVIFEEFKRLDEEKDEEKQVYALGLGLSIVDRTCQLLGTKVSLSSKAGRGSCFAFEIPLASKRAIPGAQTGLPVRNQESRDHNILSGKTIFVMEDETTTLAHTKMLLESWGCICVVAESLSQALKGSAALAFVPDLVLTDYHLEPKVTGIQAALRLREVWDVDTPVIVITSDTSPEILFEVQGHGFSLIEKPASPSRLRALLSYHLGMRDPPHEQ